MQRKIHFLKKLAQQLSSAQLFRTGSQLSSAQQKFSPAQLAQLSSAIFFKICNSDHFTFQPSHGLYITIATLSNLFLSLANELDCQQACSTVRRVEPPVFLLNLCVPQKTVNFSGPDLTSIRMFRFSDND